MKTNVSIELTDTQRNILAALLDGKETKRLATRADINTVCTKLIEDLLTEAVEASLESLGSAEPVESLESIDPEDRVALAGKSIGHIRGWNQVKRRNK